MNTSPSQQIRPASAHTFGPPEGRYLEAPQPRRAGSYRRIDDQVQDRPTLVRSSTPQPGSVDQQAIAKMFSENMFADPPAAKAFKFGPKLFTDGHARLVMLLREECGRLFSFNKSLKDKIALLEREKKQLGETIADLRSVASARADKLARLAEELREANDQLGEMDDALNQARSKRRSRVVSGYGDSIQLGENIS